MKIVIDIPEEQYELISNKIKSIRREKARKGYAKSDLVPAGWVAIADGQVLTEAYSDEGAGQ